MKRISIVIVATVLLVLQACSGDKQEADARLHIVATTGMIGDVAEQIAGDKARVTTLMGPGVDPHLYKATQGDLSALRDADVIFYNGLHLEGKMQEVFDRLEETQSVYAVTDGIAKDRLRISTQSGDKVTYDPHVWFDVQLWMQCVAHMSKMLQTADADNAAYYASRSEEYLSRLRALEDTVRSRLSAIPASNRTLITSHDAFGYFGRAYDIDVKGLQGISTAAEFGLKDITDMADLIIADSIPAVFVESSVSEKSIQAVIEGCKQRGHTVRQGGTLYSDAMGAKGTPDGTYIGMVEHNVRVISAALSGE